MLPEKNYIVRLHHLFFNVDDVSCDRTGILNVILIIPHLALWGSQGKPTHPHFYQYSKSTAQCVTSFSFLLR